MLASLLLTPAAQAATVVTACGTDVSPGGVNLFDALERGGEIIVRCADGAREITFTRMHRVPTQTTIDGGGQLTLTGNGSAPMFVLMGPKQLTLRGLSLRNPPRDPNDGHVIGIVYDESRESSVTLQDVQVADTREPFTVGHFVARNSTFTGNGDARDPDAGVVTTASLELSAVTFRDNLSRPFHSGYAGSWGGDFTWFGRSAQVVDSIFERNQRPAVWGIGQLVIRGCRFEASGTGGAIPGGELPIDTFFLARAPAAAGALEIFAARASIIDSTFRGNRGLFGGAILAQGSQVTVQSSELDGNRAAWGGAIMHVGPLPNPMGAEREPRLELRHVKLRDNAAEHDGGALLILGNLSGDVALFSGNTAGRNGGVLATIEAGPAGAAWQASDIRLARSFIVDNGGETGGAIDAGKAQVRLGNVIISRNLSRATAGTVRGEDVELANVTIAGNPGGGVRIEPGVTATGVRVANTIIAGNAAGNCLGALDRLAPQGTNLQYPEASCGAGFAVGDPALQDDFSPGAFSPARSSGVIDVCAGHDLVDGLDVYGKPRGAVSCSLGAVEANLRRNLEKSLPFGLDKNLPRFSKLVLLFFLLCLIAGILIGLFYRKRRRARRAALKAKAESTT